MIYKSVIHRYLDPSESLAEVLGLIMVLTIIVGAELITANNQLDAHRLIVAVVGCNVAWGVIDAVLFFCSTRCSTGASAHAFIGG